MKTLPAVLATGIALVLLLSALPATAAGSVTFTGPAAGAHYSGTATLSIAGTVSPAPGQTDSVFLSLTNPNNQIAWSDVATVNPTTGAFTDSAPLGGSYFTQSGAYVLSATDSFSATGSVSIQYTSTSTSGSSYNVTEALINIQGNQSIIIHNQHLILGNLTAIEGTLATWGGTLTTISGGITTIQGSLTSLASQVSSIYNTVNGLGSQVTTAANNAQSAANAVSSTQTYVLVVAVLAAITLVLELAILVRKIS